VVLEELQKRLGCGYIKANSLTDKTDQSLAFVVRDLPSLRDRIVPFFQDRLVIKREAFEQFKQVLELVYLRQHLTKEGITKIIEIAYEMNTKKRRVAKEVILSAYER
jgi:aspartate ammonia-lyase